ncbi:hypothetical protein [Sphingomonas sp. LHG3406-1]|uniref:DMP19 family protein n=1 Tax=Sphingomonas sp. LHG3406-1 TaxID=2804617 RepID=UPI00262A9A1D|nr:hypothetical protein [Sphingomonas sp. LHG3406-1]
MRVVLVSDMYKRGAVESLPRDVQGFVYGLMQQARLSNDDFPKEAVLSAAADFYLAETANGGHDGFLGNLSSFPVTLELIRDGLTLTGLDEVAGVFAALLDYQEMDPPGFEAADWSDPGFGSLDSRLHALRPAAYRTLANWLEAQPFISIVPA